MTENYHPEQYWDTVAESIDGREDLKIIAGDDEPYYRYKRRLFLELFRKLDVRGKKVLEIGSGPGGNLQELTRMGAAGITGADISSRMIGVARRNLNNDAVQLVKINGRELSFPERNFDIAFTSTVLQHNTDERTLLPLIGEICRVTAGEVILFERIESRIKGHESCLGRPVGYYAAIMKEHGFELSETQYLPLQASYYVCGAIRKIFNASSRKEGESISGAARLLENITLPVTKILDRVIPSRRDVGMLRFRRKS
ncbi:MAG: class I SAM-dependent methyltransferase [Chitinophagaceae bacterium]|nr:MAG: class I SAM-dependent methyltransferase [Chitinophagaceae bacterium]